MAERHGSVAGLPLFDAAKQTDPFEIRDYQTEALAGIADALVKGAKRILLVMPCGSGKTVVAAQLIRWAVEKGVRCLFLAHRRELVNQTCAKLERFGVKHGVIMAGIDPDFDTDHLIQVGSIQTLWARGVRRATIDLPEADLLIVDEAHGSVSRTWSHFIGHYSKGVTLGMTATPVRGDGMGLGGIYESMVIGSTVKALTDAGHLVPVRYFAPSVPDLKGVRLSGDDYNNGQLAERMDKVKLVGDIVEHWGRLAQDRQTFVFAVNVQHALNLCRQFQAVGVAAAVVVDDTPIDERAEAFRKIATGELRVLVFCMIGTEGVDVPPVSCVVLARPTRSLGLYIQMSGRALRPFLGKTDCMILDHSGAVLRHGKLDEFVDWSLDPESNIQKRQAAAKKKEAKPITCQQCKAVFSRTATCPECGHVNIRYGKAIPTADGQLVELADLPAGERKRLEMDYKRRFYSELLGYCAEKNWNNGAAAHRYREKFKVWPRFPDAVALTPGPEVRAWSRSRNIAWFKAKQKANGAQ